MHTLITLSVVLAATLSIFQINKLSDRIQIKISSNHYLDQHAKYQILLLLLSILVLVFSYFQNTDNFMIFFSAGQLAAATTAVPWFGIDDGDTWILTGPYLVLFITMGTLAFVYAQFRHTHIQLKSLLPYISWIVIFSLLNSFSEEMIFRIGIISPLYGEMDTEKLMLVSALVFGAAHFGGMPHGLLGMFMAAFLGWFLAKSVIETQGIFWAWLIHFIQDVVIYTGFIIYDISSRQKHHTLTPDK